MKNYIKREWSKHRSQKTWVVRKNLKRKIGQVKGKMMGKDTPNKH